MGDDMRIQESKTAEGILVRLANMGRHQVLRSFRSNSVNEFIKTVPITDKYANT